MGDILVALDKKFTKGAQPEYRVPFYFSIFKQDFIMILICECLITYGELFHTC